MTAVKVPQPTGRLIVVLAAGTVCAIVMLIVVTRMLRTVDRAQARGGLDAVDQLDQIRNLKEDKPE